jgi:membrane protein implicated in regulation of membrane protease activity
VFFVIAIVLALALPHPWNWAGFGVCLVLFAGEVGFWQRRVRGQKKVVGRETLIGATALVVISCRPDGQVKLGGETWSARCTEGADRGEKVTVTGIDDLTLLVEPRTRDRPS